MPLDFSTGRKPLSAFSLAGLTDIVLLLLIFFLLTSSFVTQVGIQVNLPQADATAPDLDDALTVSITDEGTYFVGENEVPEAELAAAMAAAQANRETLILRADEAATVSQFALVAATAQRLEMRVLMATEQEDD